jgi:hypothetical protein
MVHKLLVLAATCAVSGQIGRPSDPLSGQRCRLSWDDGSAPLSDLSAGPLNLEWFISADRSAPLEVVLDLIRDRDLVEFHSLLAQHLAVAMP